jgi:dienelactone hydrolase
MRIAVVSTVFVGAAALLAGCGGTGVRLTVTPASAPLDVPFTIRATGIHPDQSLTVIVSGRSINGVRWRAARKANANARGELVLRDRYLLSWLRPTPPTAYEPWPQTINVAVRGRGVHRTASARRSRPPLDSTTTRDLRPAKSGFYGQWLEPRGARHRTAILLFGGSDGDLPPYVEQIATTLAGDGYPVLEIAYFREPGLPQQLLRIRLEYLRRALHWMRAQPAVDPNRIVTFGISRGGELSLIVAATYPSLVRAAVGYVPSAEVEPAFTPQLAPAWMYRGKPYRGDDWMIPVERIRGPVFVVGADEDHLWPSGRSVRLIARRMHDHSRNDVTALAYPNAGHLVGTAVPLQTAASNIPPTMSEGSFALMRGDELGRQDSWPRLLRFLSHV